MKVKLEGRDSTGATSRFISNVFQRSQLKIYCFFPMASTKHTMVFKIKKPGHEGSQISASNPRLDHANTTTPPPRAPVSDMDHLKAQMSGLMSMFEAFMSRAKDSHGAHSAVVSTPNASNLPAVEIRDRHISMPLPETHQVPLPSKEMKRWVTQMWITVFSSSFHYYVTDQITFEQTKVFCSESVLRNLLRLTQKYKLDETQIAEVNKHIGSEVLQYLMKKYPMTQSKDVNKALQKQLKEIDMSDLLENDFLYSTGVMFEYRESGNYNDQIMRVINHALHVIDKQVEDYQEDSLNVSMTVMAEPTTTHQDFEMYMTQLFERAYEDEESIGSTRMSFMEPPSPSNGKAAARPQKNSAYADKVKEYTKYLIGRKISANVKGFSEAEIKSKTLTVKSPAILRILTKWSEELWNKFQTPKYFTNRTQSIQLQNPEVVNPFFKWMKKDIDKLVDAQKEKILEFKERLDRSNHHQQASLLMRGMAEDDSSSIPGLEKGAGMFAIQSVKALDSYILIYLNRLLHGLLTVSKTFFEKSGIDKKYEEWQHPPNLITFKIGDLLRCKMSSKEKEVIKVFRAMKEISDKFPQRMKIIRIKNRLRRDTNDILINIKFNNELVCQVQLEVISKTKDKFSLCSNSFNHYIYEMKRAIFGPISQMSSIWNNYESRTQLYGKILSSYKGKKGEPPKCTQGQKHQYEKYSLPFECSQCHRFIFHSNYITPNQQCRLCQAYQCVHCHLAQLTPNDLKKIVFFNKDKQLKEACTRVQGKIPKLGVCAKIESSQVVLQLFKECKVENQLMLLGKKNGKVYQVTDISKKSKRQAFLNSHCIFELPLLQSNHWLDIDDKAARRYTMEEQLKKVCREERDILILTEVGLTAKEIKELLKIMSSQQKKRIKKIQFASNNIKDISYLFDFKRVKELNLDHNKLTDLGQLLRFKYLHELQVRENKELEVFSPQLCKHSRLAELKITGSKISKLPPEIYQITTLKELYLDKNMITELPEKLGMMSNLEKLTLSGNQLTALPSTMEQMTGLKVLNISKNKFQVTPPVLKQISYLRNLDLSGNPIKAIPEGLDQLKCLETLKLTHCMIETTPKELPSMKVLKQLHLNGNKLERLPDEFNKLPKLQVLHAQNNQLVSLPESLKQCKHIKTALIHHNRIFEVPKWFVEFRRESTTQLNLSHNAFKQFPSNLLEMTELTHLNLSHNQIPSLPEGINGLVDLQELNMDNNKLTQIPEGMGELSDLKLARFANNNITSLPANAKQWAFLGEQGITLSSCLKGNQIAKIEDELLTHQKNKRVFTDNRLVSMPILNIVNKQVITEMNFQQNSIAAIPKDIKQFEALTRLLLGFNKITVIPKDVDQLPKLYQFGFNDNPIVQIQCFEFALNAATSLSKDICKDYQTKKGIPAIKTEPNSATNTPNSATKPKTISAEPKAHGVSPASKGKEEPKILPRQNSNSASKLESAPKRSVENSRVKATSPATKEASKPPSVIKAKQESKLNNNPPKSKQEVNTQQNSKNGKLELKSSGEIKNLAKLMTKPQHEKSREPSNVSPEKKKSTSQPKKA